MSKPTDILYLSLDEIRRRYFPENYRKKQIEHAEAMARAAARAAEEERLKVQREHNASTITAKPTLDTATAAREVWTGKDYELARKVRDELGANYTQAQLTAALAVACERYQKKNGQCYIVKNLRDGLRQRDDWEDSKARRQR
ncbi:MAG: hypothetical protein ABSG08_01100 [Terriglobales bacterium]|jgi:hypothetical protein